MTTMMPVVVAPPSAWPRHLLALAGVATAILLSFAPDVATLAHLWWTSTTFGHCLFVGPVIAWLVCQRRAQLAELTPHAWWPGLALVAAGGLGWLMGDAGSVAFARQFGLLMMLQGATVTLLGPNVARALLFPLAYSVFLVPFGEWLEPPLQRVTVAIVMPLLQLVGIPATVDGVLIHAGRYWFEVAEACSGAKFVIAMVAFGALVANVCFWSWRRRAAFMLAAVVVPVLANGVRAFGTIWAADLTSVEAATGFDHIVYGWVFFGLVMAAVLAIGWRWFDRAPDDPAFDPAGLQGEPRHTLALAPAALLVVALAACFPAWNTAIAGRAQPLSARIELPAILVSSWESQSAQPLSARIELPAIARWHRVPLDKRAAWQPWYPGADHFLVGRYADGRGNAVDLSLAVFATQHDGREVVGFGTGVLREEDSWVRVADLPPIAGGSAMRIRQGQVERVVVTWYRLGHVLTHDETRVKFETMRAHLLGGSQAATAIHLSVVLAPGIDAPATIRRFVADAGPLDRLADRATGLD